MSDHDDGIGAVLREDHEQTIHDLECERDGAVAEREAMQAALVEALALLREVVRCAPSSDDLRLLALGPSAAMSWTQEMSRRQWEPFDQAIELARVWTKIEKIREKRGERVYGWAIAPADGRPDLYTEMSLAGQRERSLDEWRKEMDRMHPEDAPHRVVRLTWTEDTDVE